MKRRNQIKYILFVVFACLLLLSAAVFAEPQTESGSNAGAELTAAEKRVYNDFSEIRMFLKGNRYPYAYCENGEYKGIYPDYLEKISDQVGIKFVFVPYESDEQLESMFTMGKADALACTYGGATGLYSTTDPFTVVEYNVVASPKNIIDEHGIYKVAISNTDIMIRHYIEEKYPNWTIIPCSDVNNAIKTVNKGKADLTFITSLDLQLNHSLLPYKHIEVQDNFSLFVPVSIAVSDVSYYYSEAIVSLLNKYITCKPIQQDSTITRKYVLNDIYLPNAVEYFSINSKILMLILAVVALLLIFFVMRSRRMRKAMEHDSLTGLWNKRKFIKEAGKRLGDGKDNTYLLAVLDVERFKIINDRFGIPVGNQTLKNIAENITSIFKGHGIFGRSTSDEFVIMTLDTEQNRGFLKQASEMDVQIHNTTYYKVPIKVGVCPIKYSEMNGMDVANFIDRAKIVNSQIKGHQDKKIKYFTKKMGEKIDRENELETIMRKSLKNNEFLVYYQPKYSLKDNKIIGAEALVRWQHPAKGLISPGDFIPLFERNGFIVDIDFYVYEQVMKMLKARIAKNKPVVPVSMNVSRCHLSSPTFTAQLEELTRKYDLPKDTIEMEITESIFSDEDKAAVALMEDLKNRNFTLSMDDFGSGYSSLNLLRELPIDVLKIDKAFLDKMSDSARSRVIVEEIISMATKINIRTVCEGVETEQQRDFLKEAGCNIAQGFFYARPMPQEDFEKLLDAEK